MENQATEPPATPPPDSQALSSPAAPPAPAPSTGATDPSDPNLRSCFICLQTSAETPGATWVNACPCTLEAHEDCMLSWVAETEASRSTKGLRCPACNGRIRVIEPYDPFVRLRDRLHRRYSKASPWVLFSIVATSATAGSSYYGLMATTAFAGPTATTRWLGIARAVIERSVQGVRVPWWRWHAGWEVGFKFWLLHLIAPALMLNKALPSLGTLLAIPASFVYGATLVAKDDMPTWPPSPAWAMTLMPYVSMTYSSMYYQLFGPLEKRLNRALRTRTPAVEEAAVPAPGPGDEADEDDDGMFAAVIRMGNALLGLFGDNEIVIEAGVNGEGELDVDMQMREIGPEGGQVDAAGEAQPGPEAAAVQGEEHQEGNAEANAEDGAAPPPPDIALQPAAAEAAAPAQQQLEPAPAEDNRQTTTFSDLINGVVSALTFPWVSWGTGEILHRTLPRAWVTPPVQNGIRRPPTGLLQQRWGRSLAGACLFILLKDAVNLYTKYRRVEVRKHRHIKNVERRRDGKGRPAGVSGSPV